MKAHSILVVDDDLVAAELLSEVLSKEGYRVELATSGEEAVKKGEAGGFDLVITDLRMPELGGLDVLGAFKRMSSDTMTIVITAFGSFETAIEAIQNGAYDYIVKPFKMDDIKQKVARCLEQKALLRKKSTAVTSTEGFAFKTIIGSSPKMLEIYKTVARVAGSDVPVLIMGESGTGKELIAKAIHDNSPRSKEPYIVINCAAFPENLLESELFGYMKGAFTNALTDKKGLLEEANGGTCFLDEIGDMPLNLQVKLLRVLQKGEIRRIGANQNIPVNVRFLAATNKDLGAMVKSRQFREDLFYRLHVVTITLPPLREHPEDIPLLVDHFFQKAISKTKKDVHGISKEAVDMLSRFNWPGNIRQLENVIERALALTSNKVLLSSDIPSELHDAEVHFAEERAGTLRTLEEIKLDYIEQILKHTGGNQNMAAEILGIDRKTLYRILKRTKEDRVEGEEEE